MILCFYRRLNTFLYIFILSVLFLIAGCDGKKHSRLGQNIVAPKSTPGGLKPSLPPSQFIPIADQKIKILCGELNEQYDSKGKTWFERIDQCLALREDKSHQIDLDEATNFLVSCVIC